MTPELPEIEVKGKKEDKERKGAGLPWGAASRGDSPVRFAAGWRESLAQKEWFQVASGIWSNPVAKGLIIGVTMAGATYGITTWSAASVAVKKKDLKLGWMVPSRGKKLSKHKTAWRLRNEGLADPSAFKITDGQKYDSVGLVSGNRGDAEAPESEVHKPTQDGVGEHDSKAPTAQSIVDGQLDGLGDLAAGAPGAAGAGKFKKISLPSETRGTGAISASGEAQIASAKAKLAGATQTPFAASTRGRSSTRKKTAARRSGNANINRARTTNSLGQLRRANTMSSAASTLTGEESSTYATDAFTGQTTTGGGSGISSIEGTAGGGITSGGGATNPGGSSGGSTASGDLADLGEMPETPEVPAGENVTPYQGKVDMADTLLQQGTALKKQGADMKSSAVLMIALAIGMIALGVKLLGAWPLGTIAGIILILGGIYMLMQGIDMNKQGQQMQDQGDQMIEEARELADEIEQEDGQGDQHDVIDDAADDADNQQEFTPDETFNQPTNTTTQDTNELVGNSTTDPT
jgi:hypothetical protein